MRPYSLPPARRRLGAALAASIAVHFSVVGALSGGSPPRRAEPLGFSSIIASLERAMPAATPAPVLELPDPSRKRVQARAEEHLVTSPGAVSSGVLSRESVPTPDGAVREAPDAIYYAARQLDVYPVLSAPLDLPYPRQALEQGVDGRALLLLHIDATGVVEEVSVVESQPAGYFEEEARRAFFAARFKPAQRNGRSVKSRVLIEVSYGESSAR